MSIQRQVQLPMVSIWKRLAFAGLAALFCIMGAIVWVLSNWGVVGSVWSTIVSISFVTLGVTGTFLQWLFPFSAAHPKKPSGAKNIPVHMQIDGVDPGISERRGALIVYVKRNSRGTSVNLHRIFIFPLIPSTSNVVQRMVNGRPIFAAVFPRLSPAHYIVHDISSGRKTRITIPPGQVTEIDWRS